MVEAIKRLDLTETRRLLQIPIVDPNIPDEYGRTAIFHVLPHPDTYGSAFADEEDRASVLCELLSNSRVRKTHQDSSGQPILLIIVKRGWIPFWTKLCLTPARSLSTFLTWTAGPLFRGRLYMELKW
ncbi:hypothetical protein IMZ48_18715 [Candidatus Bathyarchaeota archaeon]|nr:hypothetical protein [Candidatus Bathyarchaeota archaeon]